MFLTGIWGKRVCRDTRQADAVRPEESYHRIMYIALLTYTAPETEVDYALPDHSEWLRKQFTKGVFLVSGKGNGAADQVILTRSVLRGKLDAVLASDPFVIRRLARYEVIEFTATRTAQELLAINEAIAS
ncbi:Uncharacterized conserved protein YciI, contains a putative active-site phosphohistidine [Amycolatopsis pretoriensis]|uniref:Uncharacterized conserved protein YciI, contains a putative active-site phosphohistidine n=2 Tax=Amycolatopsis pretoriensis TaxID=218821 RepID=A0A1H5QJM0_9PSEU|nr:Uncharacterized conserved protein YciI, contains a putative active-site phosphohistidine [Amycolatopsis pretoriensis]